MRIVSYMVIEFSEKSFSSKAVSFELITNRECAVSKSCPYITFGIRVESTGRYVSNDNLNAFATK